MHRSATAPRGAGAPAPNTERPPPALKAPGVVLAPNTEPQRLRGPPSSRPRERFPGRRLGRAKKGILAAALQAAAAHERAQVVDDPPRPAVDPPSSKRTNYPEGSCGEGAAPSGRARLADKMQHSRPRVARTKSDATRQYTSLLPFALAGWFLHTMRNTGAPGQGPLPVPPKPRAPPGKLVRIHARGHPTKPRTPRVPAHARAWPLATHDGGRTQLRPRTWATATGFQHHMRKRNSQPPVAHTCPPPKTAAPLRADAREMRSPPTLEMPSRQQRAPTRVKCDGCQLGPFLIRTSATGGRTIGRTMATSPGRPPQPQRPAPGARDVTESWWQAVCQTGRARPAAAWRQRPAPVRAAHPTELRGHKEVSPEPWPPPTTTGSGRPRLVAWAVRNPLTSKCCRTGRA